MPGSHHVKSASDHSAQPSNRRCCTAHCTAHAQKSKEHDVDEESPGEQLARADMQVLPADVLVVRRLLDLPSVGLWLGSRHCESTL